MFPETPETFAPQIREWAQQGWLNIVGGCCGTTPPHIKAIADAVRGLPPRKVPIAEPFMRLSGLDALTIRGNQSKAGANPPDRLKAGLQTAPQAQPNASI